MVKDPDTGKRVSRPNPREDWHVVPAPDLAIVPAELFDAVRQRLGQRATVRPESQRRAKRVLSGLLRCGACGAGMSTYGKDKSGRKRLRCTRDAESGTCPDPKTFYLDAIEAAVLETLRAELRHPEVIAEFVRTYHEERKRLASTLGVRRAAAERRRGEIAREIDRLVDAIAKGHGDPAILGPRASALDTERKAIDIELAAEPERIVTLHPAALARYEEKIGRMQQSIAAGIEAGNAEHSEAIRDLVESVTVRKAGSGIEIEIRGRLNALLGEEGFPNVRRVCGAMVAGAGLEPATSGL